MRTNKTNWKTNTISFGIGLAAGLAFVAVAAKAGPSGNDWLWNVLIMPGAILVAPIYILTGGVHGSFSIVEWALAPLNGLGYVLVVKAVAGIVTWPKKKFRP